MLDDLLAHPGVEEVCELRGTFGLMAFHGGNLERGTDTIAAAAADRAGASLYAIRQPPDLSWHLPSVAFDPAASPALRRFLAHVDVVVAVHGYGREDMWTTLLLGGRNRPLAARLRQELEGGLGSDFTVVDDLGSIPERLRGQHPRNPVNLPRLAGAQLELPPRVRPGTGAPTFRPDYEAAIVDALAAVAAGWAGDGRI
ncbi:MAG TPA: poly-gamma-glutamate hydrolase family protein [Acidimicrobiales bacterium]|nr:poly-gamma-glutamate hydrolase family protein [Acidimicrobiales bacterium]